MKQSTRPPLPCWALLGAMLPMAAAMKFTQESNVSMWEYATDSAGHSNTSVAAVHGALIARSSKTSMGQHANASDMSLDAVASGKAASAIVGTFSDLANAVADAGETLGTAAGNVFSAVGNRVINAPKMRFDKLDSELKDLADELGDQALDVGNVLHGVARTTLEARYKLAGHLLDLATEVYNKAKEIATQVANAVESFVKCIAEDALAATDEQGRCKALLGKQCDCSLDSNGKAKSHLKTTGLGMDMKCVPSKTSDFAKGFRLKASASSSGEASPVGGVPLPGTEEEIDYADVSTMEATAADTSKEIRTSPEQALEALATPQPSGSCEGDLSVALDAVVTFNPDLIEVKTKVSGSTVETEAKVEGWVRASVQAWVKGEGTCSYEAQRGFPKQPKKKMICAKGVCIILAMQMLATLKLEGTLTGTVTQSYDVDFFVTGRAVMNTDTNQESLVYADIKDVKYEEGIKAAAEATASLRVSVGPKFVVWPTPGLPVTFFPQVHAQAEAVGRIEYPQGNGDRRRRSGPDGAPKAPLNMCHAAVMSIYADLGITGFALPPPLEDLLDGDVVKAMLTEAIKEGAEKAFGPGASAVANCVPGAGTLAHRIASKVATLLASALTALQLPWQLQMVELLSSDKLFCEEPWKTDGFEQSPCAEEIGCSGTGLLSLPEPGVMEMPPEVSTTSTTTAGQSAAEQQCNHRPTHIAFGDRFLEMGSFRIADHDGDHFTITHRDLSKAVMILKKDWSRVNQDSNQLNDGKWRNEAWGRPKGIEHVKGSIKMGFQFIQIGNFRLGADDWCLMVSHMDPTTKGVLREWKHDGSTWDTADRTLRDRAEGPPTGISVGWAYLQIGKFRIGYTGDSLVILNADGTYPNRIIEKFSSNGDSKRFFDDEPNLRKTFVDRPPHKWPCPQIGDIAFGTCDRGFGAWGDRFVQLGEWRLAAIDSNHFSISHRSRWTAQIFRSDGTLHPGPRTDFSSSWDRPIGFPHGITFGKNFLQIGSFRLAAMDDNHLTVSHNSGNTAQIFRNDATIHSGPTTTWNAWKGREQDVAGPAAGVLYGKHFLQLGNFRLGDADGGHFLVTHSTDTSPSTSRTIRIYRADGHMFGEIAGWGWQVTDRPTQSHCGAIQSTTGTCPGITAGDGFLQFGDWRLGTSDLVHLSFSHRLGKTAQIVRRDGILASGGTGFSTWGLESLAASSLRFGDRFIELHGFRIGEADVPSMTMLGTTTNYLTISHQLFHGGQFAILAFSRTGQTVHMTSGGLFNRAYGPPKGITFGDRFVQIGNFRLGDVDGKKFSIAHVGLRDGNDRSDKTIVVYKEDGSVTNISPPTGGNADTTVGRPFTPCKVTEIR
ncbi:unnamed protein product [Symbiodinium sp. CCMP2592]|nr:unnamed protein product [Symbiodinium sp. CCMP2592]